MISSTSNKFEAITVQLLIMALHPVVVVDPLVLRHNYLPRVTVNPNGGVHGALLQQLHYDLLSIIPSILGQDLRNDQKTVSISLDTKPGSTLHRFQKLLECNVCGNFVCTGTRNNAAIFQGIFNSS